MQTVPSSFHQKSQAGIRKHKWSTLISFDKSFDDTIVFFTLDTSLLDSGDILAPVGNNPIQYWDFYEYSPYTDRVMSMEWEREIDFPYSVQSSASSITLNNFDNYFSSYTTSPINQYLLPGRPIKLLSGYEGEPLLQQFAGLTQNKPELDQSSKTARLEALDYLSEIFKLQLSESLAMSNVRTDQALDAIFQQFGIATYQYELEMGRNTIPFLFVASGKSVADVIRKIMEAEGGKLWIDEQGVIRFHQRLLPVDDPVFEFNESNISSISTTGDTAIINRVRITSKIRVVQPVQPIHTGSGELANTTLSKPIIVPAGSTQVYNIKLDDPLGGYSEPTLGFLADDSWFTAVNEYGSSILSGVTVSASTLSIDTLKLTFSNANAYDAYINAIEVYGEPARVVDTLTYEAFDQDSIDKYGEYLLDVQNDLFGSESNCESFALTVIDAYSQFDSIVEMSVKGNPALQLGDIIIVDTRKVSGQFQIIKISDAIRSDGVSQVIKARRYTPRHWFFTDVSLLDGTDVLAP